MKCALKSYSTGTWLLLPMLYHAFSLPCCTLCNVQPNTHGKCCLSLHRSDGTPLLTEEESKTIPMAADERVVLEIVFGALRKALNDTTDGHFLVLGDSQEHQWLPPQENSLPEHFLKPDGYVIHKAFVNKDGKKPASRRLFDCIRSIVEGKSTNACGTAAMGEVVQYAKALAGLKIGVKILNVRTPRA